MTEGDDDYLRAAATLLQLMAAEMKPLSALDARIARAIEALQSGIEALIPVVEFIPTVSEGSVLDELRQLAKSRVAGLVEEFEQIAHQVELLASGFRVDEGLSF